MEEEEWGSNNKGFQPILRLNVETVSLILRRFPHLVRSTDDNVMVVNTDLLPIQFDDDSELQSPIVPTHIPSKRSPHRDVFI